jgi:hypothetical protein
LRFPQLLHLILKAAFEGPPFDPNLPIWFPPGRGKSRARPAG